MKRSEINRAIKKMEKYLALAQISLPSFCQYQPSEWRTKGVEYQEVYDNMLGWDITDFGLGDFKQHGLSLITLRNGNLKLPQYKKPYAEKMLFLRGGQKVPMHYHRYKMEDIINKNGGNVLITVYQADQEGKKSSESVTINCDGCRRTVPAGYSICLQPGQSICIEQGIYHDFSLEQGSEWALLGEVSMCNDDANDNFFFNPKVGRFPEIIEDELPYRLLCAEYEDFRNRSIDEIKSFE